MKEISMDGHLESLAARRESRRREDGDGLGIDIGISPGGYHVAMEKHINGLSPETKKRLLEHVRHHVDEAMKPLIRLMERAGDDEYSIRLFRGVGPNSLRTVIEHLETEAKD